MRHDTIDAGDRAAAPRLLDLHSDEDLARELLARILGREAAQPDLITAQELVAEIARECLAPGAAMDLARRAGVHHSEISRNLRGSRPIVSRNLAKALGYRKVTRYERIG